MRAVAAVPPNLAAAARLSRSPFYNSRLRTTCVATRVEAGHANNALPQRARAVVNCRIMPGLPGADVEAVIRRLAGPKVTVTVIEPPVNSPPSPVPPALLARLERLAGAYWPGSPCDSHDAGRATDGMYTRNAGTPTYGLSALEEDPDDVRSHGKDERVGVEDFFRATRFWYELTKSVGWRPVSRRGGSMTRTHYMSMCAAVVRMSVATAIGQQSPVGYDDTPMQPNGQWRVHDGRRPQPPVVAPGGRNDAAVPPPADATVLLGSRDDLSGWQMTDGSAATWTMKDGILLTGKGVLQTKRQFTDCQLHVEWATPPSEVKGNSQGRGNSGVFLHGPSTRFQVLDSYNNPTYPDGQAGCDVRAVSAARQRVAKPGEWQSYDIIFTAPRFALTPGSSGRRSSPCFTTAWSCTMRSSSGGQRGTGACRRIFRA